MKVGYARVSTEAQQESLTTQRGTLQADGCQRVFEDTANGVKFDRLSKYGPHSKTTGMRPSSEEVGSSVVQRIRCGTNISIHPTELVICLGVISIRKDFIRGDCELFCRGIK